MLPTVAAEAIREAFVATEYKWELWYSRDKADGYWHHQDTLAIPFSCSRITDYNPFYILRRYLHQHQVNTGRGNEHRHIKCVTPMRARLVSEVIHCFVKQAFYDFYGLCGSSQRPPTLICQLPQPQFH